MKLSPVFGLSFAAILLCPLPLAAENKQLLWGDTHLHTTYSSDAFANNNLLAEPDTAYRYAIGEPVIHPYHRARVQIETPLDFLVVSDHAEYLGLIRHLYYNGAGDAELGLVDGLKVRFVSWLLQRRIAQGRARELFISVLPEPGEPREAVNEILGSSWLAPMPEVEIDIWNRITEAADRYNRPGEFTAMIGWEWSSIPGGGNLHRVVVTDTNAATAQQFQPFGLDDSPYPEDLWRWLEDTSSALDADFVAIPHNSNISKGAMFDTLTLRGEPFSEEYLQLRRQWEPIAEITQIKGDSETHPDLSPNDPFADFETYPFYIQREAGTYRARAGDYLRPALLRGLEMAKELGTNPFELGFIGSTDSHTSLSSAEEGNFHGKLATDSIPENKTNRWAENAGPSGWAMSASGLAAVWAQENTREAILAAFRRREVYATTGPRIGVQFFAGWGYATEDLQSGDLYQRATQSGVPMGGNLRAVEGQGPLTIIVQATRDPAGANLDRIQIVKGWLDSAGKAQEKVYDVAWSDGREPGADGSLPPVGNTVNLATGTWSDDIGAAQLLVAWQDPDFDPAQPAFYYSRVLQVPTPRHSLLDARALGLESAPGFPDTIQERAYTSPVWYQPVGSGLAL
ncbi:hypothetical protein CWI75_06685 [Kineobactrum sediminis]|uniref:DUF3604 domain-containing protein n=1 Tax=Kineobactrum sediminis TaxID=1905677 RepID=A0A2N5Y3W9_9GAMM|nr:DUF3604 domain-containing protein [Kineobactrum sediminis]PLW83101.1 hypothetical protein CWI75_06685 [Kineobactrum sediminis]